MRVLRSRASSFHRGPVPGECLSFPIENGKAPVRQADYTAIWSPPFAVTAKLKIEPVNGRGLRRRLRNLDGTFIFFLSHFSQHGRPHGLILYQEYADDFLEAVDLCLPIFDGRLVPAGREISMIRFENHKFLPTVLDIIRARNHSVHGRREFVLSTSMFLMLAASLFKRGKMEPITSRTSVVD